MIFANNYEKYPFHDYFWKKAHPFQPFLDEHYNLNE
jgi:hypothetical protein